MAAGIEPVRARSLVTGCAGFIGSHLSERLVDRGVPVVGVDCFTGYYPRELKRRNLWRLRDEEIFRLHEVDLSRDPLAELLEGVEVVYHLAAQPGVRGSFGVGFEQHLRHNLHATQRLLEACQAAGVQRFVYASSSSVYGDAEAYPTDEARPRRPRSPYGLTKLATEELVATYHRQTQARAAGLRYFTVYGPRQRPDMAFTRFFLAGLEGRPISVMGDGRQVRDFTYIDDAVDATLAAARAPSPLAIYNVGGGSQIRLLDAIQLIGELLERPLRIERRPAARGDVRRTCSDPGYAQRELGFRPRVPLRDGLAEQMDWVLAHARALEGATA